MHQAVLDGGRPACTSGGIVVITENGTSRRVPAGTCWVGRRHAFEAAAVISWTERGIEYYGEVPYNMFHSYLTGCLLQYSSA